MSYEERDLIAPTAEERIEMDERRKRLPLLIAWQLLGLLTGVAVIVYGGLIEEPAVIVMGALALFLSRQQ